MRIYKKTLREEAGIEEIFCNCCGKKIEKDKYGYFPDHFHADKTWGYNSSMDGRRQSFDLCHECYESMLENFKIPAE